ncbi:MAG TPA: metallophosphoesterase [Anaerolineae bacterium]|nr:metallophosphoesterase [Anaerolineae bacterium]
MSGRRLLGAVSALIIFAILILAMWLTGRNVYAIDQPITASPADCGEGTRVAVIGDYGQAGQPEADVAALIDRWGVGAIVTAGDNNYMNGGADTIDANIGQYYHAYIAPYTGSYGAGAGTNASENSFFPALGNHDWYTTGAQPYFAYFTLPGNERYYTVQRGPIEFFILDTDPNEPDGYAVDSPQAHWLRDQLAASSAPWKIVVQHYPPYSSSARHGSDPTVQWPFAAWGAHAVIAGHDHLYERLQENGIPYFVNGAGGKDLYPFKPWSVPGSIVRYNQDYGAQLINATAQCLNLSFFSRAGTVIDSVTLRQ